MEKPPSNRQNEKLKKSKAGKGDLSRKKKKKRVGEKSAWKTRARGSLIIL